MGTVNRLFVVIFALQLEGMKDGLLGSRTGTHKFQRDGFERRDCLDVRVETGPPGDQQESPLADRGDDGTDQLFGGNVASPMQGDTGKHLVDGDQIATVTRTRLVTKARYEPGGRIERAFLRTLLGGGDTRRHHGHAIVVQNGATIPKRIQLPLDTAGPARRALSSMSASRCTMKVSPMAGDWRSRHVPREFSIGVASFSIGSGTRQVADTLSSPANVAAGAASYTSTHEDGRKTMQDRRRLVNGRRTPVA